mmetsp:Transcript_41494/g.83101  ORF Transcript_41494/g.83101 Transcript_41494/m.83101 type:complete len:207 (-) Transcript_41494:665-1285(-)
MEALFQRIRMRCKRMLQVNGFCYGWDEGHQMQPLHHKRECMCVCNTCVHFPQRTAALCSITAQQSLQQARRSRRRQGGRLLAQPCLPVSLSSGAQCAQLVCSSPPPALRRWQTPPAAASLCPWHCRPAEAAASAEPGACRGPQTGGSNGGTPGRGGAARRAGRAGCRGTSARSWPPAAPPASSTAPRRWRGRRWRWTRGRGPACSR